MKWLALLLVVILIGCASERNPAINITDIKNEPSAVVLQMQLDVPAESDVCSFYVTAPDGLSANTKQLNTIANNVMARNQSLPYSANYTLTLNKKESYVAGQSVTIGFSAGGGDCFLTRGQQSFKTP